MASHNAQKTRSHAMPSSPTARQLFDRIVNRIKDQYAANNKAITESEAIDAARRLIRYYEILENSARKQIENQDQHMIDHFKTVLAGYENAEPEAVSLVAMSANINKVDHDTILKAMDDYIKNAESD